MKNQTRRQFIKKAGITVGSSLILPTVFTSCKEKPGNVSKTTIPPYLRGYEELYQQDQRAAAVEWFRDAKFGLFLCYGLYSLEGRGEWLQLMEKIHIAEYAKLEKRFTAEKFDADFITDLMLEAEMKYITFVAKHCDSFCLWDTKYTDFNSVNSPAKKDFVAELAEQCNKKGLGLFVFYEHGFDWRHPHGPSPWDWKCGAVRPKYEKKEPFYAYGDDYDFQKYLDYATGQIKELLTNYGPVAGIWLDGVAVPRSGDASKFKLEELYTMIRKLQPQTLISYKSGITGTEDFYAPEKQQIEWIKERGDKPMEVCDVLQDVRGMKFPGHRFVAAWGYVKGARHISAEELMKKLEWVKSLNANLAINTGPMPDGSIHPEDVKTLREVGKLLRQS
ncbi:MAG: alpha-L-fucosidase [Planctomycetota bacterium]|jgi:alpha-L-fucosidase